MDKPTALELYRKLLRIRRVEEKVAELYPGQEIRTPVHLSIGQEAVSVGVCANLSSDEPVFCSHRCHAAYLAKGGDLRQFFAELFGRQSGSNSGRGGSAHLGSDSIRLYSGAILGGMIPLAVGSAFSFKMDGKRSVAVAFLGDAAMEEGVLSESLNFASVKGVPVLFVCENNLFSTHIPLALRQPDVPIYRRAAVLGIESARLDGNDLTGVHEAARKAVAFCRDNARPYFLECLTYRMREHVGPLFDFENPYRGREEYDAWLAKCPVRRMKEYLRGEGWLSDSLSEEMENGIRSEIAEAVGFAGQSPWPERSTLTSGVY